MSLVFLQLMDFIGTPQDPSLLGEVAALCSAFLVIFWSLVLPGQGDSGDVVSKLQGSLQSPERAGDILRVVTGLWLPSGTYVIIRFKYHLSSVRSCPPLFLVQEKGSAT